MKKTLFKVILTLGIVLTSLFAITVVNADAAQGKVYGASTGRVYLRYSPASSSYISLVYNGTSVTTYYSQYGYDGNYYTKCYVPGVGTGWITSRYVYDRAYITGASTGNVYIWSDSYSQSAKAIIPNGSTVYVKNTYGNRMQGYYYGTYGWFTSQYVRYY